MEATSLDTIDILNSDLVPEGIRGEGPLVEDIYFWVGQIYSPAFVCHYETYTKDINLLFKGTVLFTDSWNFVSEMLGNNRITFYFGFASFVDQPSTT